MSEDIKPDFEEVEYVYEPPPESDLMKEFANVFQKFTQHQSAPTLKKENLEVNKDRDGDSLALVEASNDNDKVDSTEKSISNDEDQNKKVSKRKIKEATRMSVAELKQRVDRPELVELHDISAVDPIFLLHLKSNKNSVPVPRHWSSKRRYLQGKRGYEKPAFLLPDFIRQTGIMEMRDSVQGKDDAKSLKAKTRERVQPKMGKIQMDYQQLHDAFFKWQTRPKLSAHGDLYYEGKEFERKFKKKPGELSNELRKALGMPVGPHAHRSPPPWLGAMKRHGPPPSYPYLKIPGLNCAFPDELDGGTEGDDQNMAFETETNASDGE